MRQRSEFHYGIEVYGMLFFAHGYYHFLWCCESSDDCTMPVVVASFFISFLIGHYLFSTHSIHLFPFLSPFLFGKRLGWKHR